MQLRHAFEWRLAADLGVRTNVTTPHDMPIEPPVIAVGDGQLELFRSPDRLAGCIEAVDAELYRGYDAKGRPLQITGEYKQSRGWLGIGTIENGPVTVALISEDTSHAEELRLALLDWWNRTGGSRLALPAGPPEAWGLADLVAAVAARDGIK